MTQSDFVHGLFDDHWSDGELYLDVSSGADAYVDVFVPGQKEGKGKWVFVFDGESCSAIEIERERLVQLGPFSPRGGRNRIALITPELEPAPPGDMRALGFVIADIRLGDVSIRARMGSWRAHTRSPEDLDWMPEQALVKDEFDVAFYLSQFEPTRRPKAPLLHYLVAGWRLGFDPAPSFSTNGYLRLNSDVRDAGVSPFPHFIATGRHEGRSLIPSELTSSGQRSMARDDQNVAERLRPHFDAEFYLHQLGDAAPRVTDPVMHYCMEGWRRGLDPRADFSTAYYLEANPDIVQSGMNPFLHYVIAGKLEGRLPHHPGGAKVMRLREMKPLEQIVHAWRAAPVAEPSLTAGDIAAALRVELTGASRGVLIALCHDNYKQNPGGVQFCIEIEQRLAGERGVVYLAVHPAQPLPRLAHVAETPDNAVQLTLVGQNLGACSMHSLVEAVAELAAEGDAIQLVVHHMLGHLPEQIVALAKATGRQDCHLWLHDFFTLCPSYALQRNNITFCGAPPVTSNACGLCLFGEERRAHQRRLEAFFGALDVHLLSPSEVTRAFWTTKAAGPVRSITVIPHVDLAWSPRPAVAQQNAAPPIPSAEAPLRIAFLGTIAAIKGWPVFAELARRFGGRDDMEFLLFGLAPPPIPRLRHIPVHVTADTRMAMVDAVAEHEVDLVLHWAGWPETFSLSTYEAMAGGAFVLTNPGSGNVAQTVRRTRRGLVLEDEDALMRCIVDGRAAQLATEARQRRRAETCHWTLSEMTIGQLYPERPA